MISVSGSGVDDAEGVLEEKHNVEESDTTRRETPSSERFAKPLA